MMKSRDIRFRIAYAYTVKCVKGTIESIIPSTYEPFFNRLGRIGSMNIQYKVFEKDKNGRLHVHGVFDCHKFARVDINMNGYSIRIEPIYDMQGWLSYIAKDQEGRYLKKYTKVLTTLTEEQAVGAEQEGHDVADDVADDVAARPITPEPTYDLIDTKEVETNDAAIITKIRKKLF